MIPTKEAGLDIQLSGHRPGRDRPGRCAGGVLQDALALRAPEIGEHTREILAEVAYDDEDIAALIA